MNISNKIVNKYPDIVEKICLASIVAGLKIIHVYSKHDFGIEVKPDNSPVTLADRLADKVIVESLKLNFPEIPVVSEESHCDLDLMVGKIYFLVDPLDGTKEFIKRTGDFTVNIAVIIDGKAELGVVYVPVTGELYYRDLDGFSYMETDIRSVADRGQRKRISCRAVNMNDISVVRSVSHFNAETEAYLSKYSPKKSRSAGSSLKFGMIACGVADLYPRLGRTMEWDTGAAHAVLKGAGGNVRRLDTLKEILYGKPGLENPFFVASSDDMVLLPFDGEA